MDNGDEQRFLVAVQFLLRLRARGALDYLLHEAGWVHYCLLRETMLKRCQVCGMPGCPYARKHRHFKVVQPCAQARIIE